MEIAGVGGGRGSLVAKFGGKVKDAVERGCERITGAQGEVRACDSRND